MTIPLKVRFSNFSHQEVSYEYDFHVWYHNFTENDRPSFVLVLGERAIAKGYKTFEKSKIPPCILILGPHEHLILGRIWSPTMEKPHDDQLIQVPKHPQSAQDAPGWFVESPETVPRSFPHFFYKKSFFLQKNR